MAGKYTEGQAVSINPNTYNTPTNQADGVFRARAKVVSSRYASTDYPPDSGFQNKIAIKWTLKFPSGAENTKTYSTGTPYNAGLADISTDGKRVISRSPDFQGFNPSSDALYLIRRAIAAGFPENLLSEDISAFEGHAFFVEDGQNPSWKGSGKKPYPKEYLSNWDEVVEAYKSKGTANAVAQSTPKTSTAALQGTYAPPQVVVDGPVQAAASSALLEILAANGGVVKRTKLPAEVGKVASGKGWSQKTQQGITLALWDINSLTQIALAAGLKVDGEQVSFA